eukprot:gene8208-8292_t
MGWGIIDVEGSKLMFVACGSVHSDAKLSLAERLRQLHDGLSQIIADHEPDEAAVEETFVNTDPQATLKLGQARGIALVVPSLAGLSVAEYGANKVKKTVVGAGHAEKDQVQMMVKVLLPKSGVKSADAADALAIAICHAQHRGSNALKKALLAGMIGKLKGIVDSYAEDHIILDVNGVGYVVACSGRTLQKLPKVGEAVALAIETQVREDAIRLFGFASDAERDWFRLLQTVQGVGAKVALAILSILSPAELTSAIALQDKASVSRASGVGPRLATRIVAELKDKAPGFGAVDPNVMRLAGEDEAKTAPKPAQDAISALVNLGYGRPQAAAAVAAAMAALGTGKLTNPKLTSPEKRDDDLESSIRPQTLADFTGQAALRANLKVFIEAAKARGEALDHVLFVGPPGLGKTTLAQIVARELGANFRSTSGPVIAKAGDLAAQLTNLEERDVLFIDEIHRLNPAVEEILYPAMEDFQLDLIIGEGPAARSVKIDLAKFTLVGATTRAGLLTTPLRDRFGIPMRLNFYTVEELEGIVARGARVLGIPMSADGANEIAKRARGTPRIAGRLLRRVRDFAIVDDVPSVTRVVADKALKLLDVDAIGLDQMDRRYLEMVAVNFGGGPVGIETIAAALSEPRDAIEDIIEPYLLQQGFLQRTPRGRLLTPHAFKHLGLTEPAAATPQFRLFDLEDEG